MLSSQEILKELKSVIDTEASALQALSQSVDEVFVRAVEMIFASSHAGHKVIVTGMGKSGYVARKMAATMSSTGTLAVFMHPGEAMHGDLGLVKAGDVVIAIGRSGESEELNLLLPSLKRLGAKVVAITAKGQSTLAREADVALVTGDCKEAGPYDLAPTTSSLVAMSVGDALAMTLMKIKNFKPEDFAMYHPGGQLGRRLLLKVQDVMVPLSKCSVLDASASSLEDVVGAIGEFGVVLFSKDGKKIDGILTDGDLRRALKKLKEGIFTKKVTDLMNSQPQTVESSMMAIEALGFMEKRERPLNVVPVTDRQTLVGLLRIHDLLKL